MYWNILLRAHDMQHAGCNDLKAEAEGEAILISIK